MISQREVTIVKEDSQGRPVFSYAGAVVYVDERVTVARCPWPSERSMDLGGLVIAPGDLFIEYYYADQWFNVFAIHDAVGRLKGWYCNVTRPAQILADQIAWQDLELDLLVLPDGRQRVLDEDEFAELALESDECHQTAEGLARLRRWATEGRAPFGALRPSIRNAS
jgi:hypothetical protein